MSAPSPELSIIIVSYNAEAFLRICLWAVKNALKQVNAEVLLIDNDSKDGTLELVRTHFSFINIIPNSKNLGFSKANNKALSQAKGDIALLLNPDTIVPENAFSQIINYYKANPNTGGIGVKMIDGSGQFLPESKRGIPTLARSIGRLTGLQKLFPNYRKMDGYYANHINPNKDASVEILSGAFMAFPMKLFPNHKPLHEAYFMYGEDIELSFDLLEFKRSNIYLGSLPIIHFKGESTPLSTQMLGHFYNAMWIFYSHVFRNKRTFITNTIVYLAIQSALFLAKLRLPSRKRKEQTKLPSSANAKHIAICSNNQTGPLDLSATFPHSKITFCTSQEAIAIISKQHPTHFIFDLKNINAKEVIEIVNQSPQKTTFGFIAPEGKHILFSGHHKQKGAVLSIL